MPLPRAGDGTVTDNEVYLLSTTGGVAPSFASEQAGPQPGPPIADAANLDDGVEVALSGVLRSGATSDPTIELKAEDLGKLAAFRGAGQTVGDLLRKLGRGEIGPRQFRLEIGRLTTSLGGGEISVPRFSVQRTNWDNPQGSDTTFVGVSEDFNRWPIATSEIVAAGGSVFRDVGALVEASDKTLRLCLIEHVTATSAQHLHVYSYNPATDTDWVLFKSLTNIHTRVANASAIAATRIGDDIYIYIGAIDVTATHPAKLYVYRLSGLTPGATASITAIGGAIPMPNIADAGTIWGAGIAATTIADSSLIAASICTLGLFCSGPSSSRTIVFGRSSDQKSWGGLNPEEPLLTSASDLFITEPGEVFSALSFSTADTTRGWATTTTGKIFHTRDGGRSWAKQKSPVESANTADRTFVVLRSVFAVPGSNTNVWAVGENGCILKTTDGGETWKINRYYGTVLTSDDDWEEIAYRKLRDSSSTDLYGIAFDTAAAGWVVGAAGIIEYTSNTGATWTYIVQRKVADLYLCIVSEGGNVIQVGGTNGVHANITNSEQTIVVRLTNAHTVTPTATYFVRERRWMRAMSRATNGTIYGVASRAVRGSSRIWKWNGSTWKAIREVRDTLTAVQVLPADADKVFAVGNHMWRTKTGTTTAEFMSVASPVRPATAVYFNSEDVGIIAGRGLAYQQARQDDRAFPALLGLPSGKALIAWSNMIRGRVEVFIMNDPLGKQSAILVDDTLQFTPITNNTISGDLPRPTFARTDAGEIILFAGAASAPPTVAVGAGTGLTGKFRYKYTIRTTATEEETLSSKSSDELDLTGVNANKDAVVSFAAAGSGKAVELYRSKDGGPFYFIISRADPLTSYTDAGVTEDQTRVAPATDGARVSLDDGLTWLNRDDLNLPIPVGAATYTADYTITGFRRYGQALATRGGRIFRAVRSTNGADGAKLGTFVAREWKGASATVGAIHFVPIMPNLQWWVLDDVYVRFNGIPTIGNKWKSVPAYDYPKSHLSIDSPSIYTRSKGTTGDWILRWNRQDADITTLLGAAEKWEVYGFALFGTNCWKVDFGLSNTEGSGYTEYSVDRSAVGTLYSYQGPGAATTKSILKITGGVTLIPHQWKPGIRRWYLYNVTSAKVYEIIDNSANAVVIKNTADTLGATGTFRVFNDRLLILPSGLNISDTRFAQFVRVKFPAQSPPDGYRKLGTPILGIYAISNPSGYSERRRRFSPGFGWQPITNTLEDTGISGVSSVQHFGRTGQRWALPYEHVPWWDRDMQLLGILPELRQAFCLIFNGTDVDTAELVRLVDAPELVNTFGDRYSWRHVLREVA